jgi:hypothetical protein
MPLFLMKNGKRIRVDSVNLQDAIAIAGALASLISIEAVDTAIMLIIIERFGGKAGLSLKQIQMKVFSEILNKMLT